MTTSARARTRIDAGHLAGIQYTGGPGTTQECVNAVVRLIQCDAGISKAIVLTASRRHGLLLTVYPGDLVAIKAGFTSGYAGEGPRGLSRVLALLYGHGIDIEEVEVKDGLLERLNDSALTGKDIGWLEAARPVRPWRWPDYIDGGFPSVESLARMWRDCTPVMPFAIIDDRLFDLALAFWKSPDEHLMTGYRRLEDVVRQRTGIADHGASLFSAAFLTTPQKLGWNGCQASEQKGRAQLFTSAYMAYRNPRAHRELDEQSGDLLGEFLLLNHLYSLEKNAVLVVGPAVP